MRSRSHITMARRAILAAAGVGLSMLGGQSSIGFTVYQYGSITVTWPGSQSLRYLSPSSFPAESIVEQDVLEAMGLWNIVPGSDFRYAFSRLTQDFPIDHFDGFNDTAAVPDSQLDPGVLGVTYLVNDGAKWFDMDVLFNAFPLGIGYTFDPNPPCQIVQAPTPTNGFSFLLVAVHELGHALGLGHDPIGDEAPGTPWFIATMNPGYPSGGPFGQENIVEVHADDRGGARLLYPHSGPSPLPQRDLASASFATGATPGRAVPLPFTPTIVFPGDEVTARSVIENLGSTSEFTVRQGFYLSTDETIDAGDLPLGALYWDIAFGDAFEFEVIIPMPADPPAGTYTLGSLLDDGNQIAEVYEDNNAVGYCEPLTITQLPPAIRLPDQAIIACSAAYTGPSPTVTHPLNMSPVVWSLDNPPSGMTIDSATGVISWPQPVRSPFAYALVIRATNDAGSGTKLFFLGVNPETPVIAPIADEYVSCRPRFVSFPPLVTVPRCMDPIILWSIEHAPPGVTIDANTGVLSWPNPIPSPTPYVVTIRASNAVGSGARSFGLHVRPGDFDGSGSVSLPDYVRFAECLSGPRGGLPGDCSCGDHDADADADLSDFAALQRLWAP